MNITVKIKAHRILRKMRNYHSFDSFKDYNVYPLNLDLDEVPLGVYENEPNQVEQSIIITNKGLHHCINNKHSEKIDYLSILKVNFPTNKDKTEALEINTHDNKCFYFPIKRSLENNKFSDVFEFIRFIDRVKEDLDIVDCQR